MGDPVSKSFTMKSSLLKILKRYNIWDFLDVYGGNRKEIEMVKHFTLCTLIKQSYVITIRENRFRDFIKDIPDTLPLSLLKINGTNGKYINYEELPNYISHKLRRGEIGCFDSHLRALKDIIKNKIECGIIFEDDARMILENGKSTLSFYKDLNKIARELLETNCYHLCYLYISDSERTFRGPSVTRNLQKIFKFNTLAAYMVTLEGAKKIVQHSTIWDVPFDDFIVHLDQCGVIHTVGVKKSLFKVADYVSDTVSIL
jgi:GR25 family glycosyltransferase involved in LPS biosynthesis